MPSLTYNPPRFTTPPPTPTLPDAPSPPTTPMTTTFSESSIQVEPRRSPERKPMLIIPSSAFHHAGTAEVSTRAHALLDFSRRISHNKLPDAVKQQMLASISGQMEEAAKSEESSIDQKAELQRRVEQSHRGIDVTAKRLHLRQKTREKSAKFKSGFRFVSSAEREHNRTSGETLRNITGR